MSLWDTNLAALRWLRDPGMAGFENFAIKQRRLLKQQPPRARTRHTQQILNRILTEELQRFPTHRRLTPRETDDLIRAVSARAAQEIKGTVDDILTTTYLMSLGEVGREVGAQFSFTPRHRQAVELVTEGEGLAETFSGFSDALAESFRGVVQEAFDEGQVDPRRMSSRMVSEAGSKVRYRLDRIANTETAKVWNLARMQGYQEAEEELGTEFLYRFGPRHLGVTRRGHSQCEACTHAIDMTRDGMPMDELIETLVMISTTPAYGGSPNWEPLRDSEFPTIHPNCRHVAPMRTNII